MNTAKIRGGLTPKRYSKNKSLTTSLAGVNINYAMSYGEEMKLHDKIIIYILAIPFMILLTPIVFLKVIYDHAPTLKTRLVVK